MRSLTKKNKLDIPNRLHLKIRRKYNKFRSFDNHTMLFLKFFLSVLDANGVVHRSHSPLLFIKNIYVIFYQYRGPTVQVSYYAACSLFVYIIDQLYHLVSYMMALVLPMQRFADN
jgi:hypothetical protein